MKLHVAIAAVAAAFALASSALAQALPSTIRIVVPFSAGGGSDIPARLIAAELTRRLSTQVVVDNSPGAGGNLGADQVAKGPRDGSLLLMGTVNITSINPLLYKSMPFDPAKDLAPISLTAIAPNVLVVSEAGPIKSLDDLLAAARSAPDRVNFGSAGSGTTLHLAGELLKTMAGVQMTHVPYKGAPVALPDVIEGRLTTMFVAVPAALPLIRSGKLRPIGVSGLARVPTLPEVRTLDQQGLRGFDAVAWHGLFAPAGTPQAVIQRLHAEVTAVLALPDIRQRFSDMGLEVATSTPVELGKLVLSDREKWADVVRRSGATLD